MSKEANTERPTSMWEVVLRKDMIPVANTVLTVMRSHTAGTPGIETHEKKDIQNNPLLVVVYTNKDLQGPVMMDGSHAWERFTVLLAEATAAIDGYNEEGIPETSQALFLEQRLLGFIHAKREEPGSQGWNF